MFRMTLSSLIFFIATSGLAQTISYRCEVTNDFHNDKNQTQCIIVGSFSDATSSLEESEDESDASQLFNINCSTGYRLHSSIASSAFLVFQDGYGFQFLNSPNSTGESIASLSIETSVPPNSFSEIPLGTFPAEFYTFLPGTLPSEPLLKGSCHVTDLAILEIIN